MLFASPCHVTLMACRCCCRQRPMAFLKGLSSKPWWDEDIPKWLEVHDKSILWRFGLWFCFGSFVYHVKSALNHWNHKLLNHHQPSKSQIYVWGNVCLLGWFLLSFLWRRTMVGRPMPFSLGGLSQITTGHWEWWADLKQIPTELQRKECFNAEIWQAIENHMIRWSSYIHTDFKHVVSNISLLCIHMFFLFSHAYIKHEYVQKFW